MTSAIELIAVAVVVVIVCVAPFALWVCLWRYMSRPENESPNHANRSEIQQWSDNNDGGVGPDSADD